MPEVRQDVRGAGTQGTQAEVREEGEAVKALSVRAPWWWAILHGKPVENREWYTNFRGTVLLHASKHWSRREIEEDLDDIRYMAEEDGIMLPEIDLAWMLECGGCIVGSVRIVDCVHEHPSAFFVGEYGFVLRDAVEFRKPVPFRGALGFFDVPEEAIYEPTSPIPSPSPRKPPSHR